MRFSFESRCRIVQLILAGESPPAAAAACGASRATGYRLWWRYQEGGWCALSDRPSTPHSQPRRLLAEVEQEILAWREHLHAGPAVIAAILERPISTVGKVLRRAGRSRLPRPQRDPRVRYERDYPGALLHVDTKKLGRFHMVGKRILRAGVNRSPNAGWQHLHVAIDDHSRLAYAELLARDDCHACTAFLARATAWYHERGITVERVLTDNAKAYHSHAWLDRCAELGIARRYTRPYSPWTNGKAEALIKTLLRECLPLRLSDQHTPNPRPPQLPPLVQPKTPTRLTRRTATDQPRLTPVWSLHLDQERIGALRLWTFGAEVAPFSKGWREARGPDDDGRDEGDPKEDRHHDTEAPIVAGVEIDPPLHDEARDDHQRDDAYRGQRSRRQQITSRDQPVGEEAGCPHEESGEQGDPAWDEGVADPGRVSG
jgi:transposase InsO family protein